MRRVFLGVGVVVLLLLAVLQDSRELDVIEVSSLDGRLAVHVVHLKLYPPIMTS